MPSLQNLLVHALWVLGLSGVLATGSYLQWRRTVRSQSWRFVVHTPRFLFPLCLSVALISTGAALSERLGIQPNALWESLLWGGLALVFFGQSAWYAIAGDKHGWDTSTEGK